MVLQGAGKDSVERISPEKIKRAKNALLVLGTLPAIVSGASAAESLEKDQRKSITSTGGEDIATLELNLENAALTEASQFYTNASTKELSGRLFGSRNHTFSIPFSARQNIDTTLRQVLAYLSYMDVDAEKNQAKRLSFAKSLLEDNTTRVVSFIKEKEQAGYTVVSRGKDSIVLAQKSGTVIIDKTIELPHSKLRVRMPLEQVALIEVTPSLEVKSVTLQTQMSKSTKIKRLFTMGPYWTQLKFSPLEGDSAKVQVTMRGSMQLTTHRPLFSRKIERSTSETFQGACRGVLRRATNTVASDIKKGDSKLTIFQMARKLAALARAVRAAN